MSSAAGPSSKPVASQKKERKQKNSSNQNGSKSAPVKQKASGTGPANADTSKPLAPNKKAVLRPVLDNPLRIEWPNIPLNVENNILALAVQLLETVRLYHEQRSESMRRTKNSNRARSHKRKATDQIDERRSKKGKAVPASESATEKGGVSSEGTASTLKRKREASASDDESDESEEESSLPPPKKRKPDGPPGAQDGTVALAPTRPEMLDHVVFGLNAVTKRLEAQSFGLRSPSNKDLPPPSSASSEALHTAQSEHSEDDRRRKVAPLRLVLVCRTDIDSPTMIAHLPTLTAACNSAQRPQTEARPLFPDVLLVGLPYGAESTLAEGSGLRRAAVVAFDTETPGLEERLAGFLPSIPILRAHWLAVAPVATASASSGSSKHPSAKNPLAPTHIKHLKTTAPQDAKAAKQKRAEEIREAKARQRADRKNSQATGAGRPFVRGDKGDGKGEAKEAVGVGTSATGPKDKSALPGRQKSKKERDESANKRPRRTLEKVILRPGAPTPERAD